MEHRSLKAHDVVRRLAAQRRVIVLGGIAVVLHGLHRTTKDVDLWIDPLEDEQHWAAFLREFLESEALTAARVGNELGEFIDIPMSEIASAVADDRFVRVVGADRPIDAFRVPNYMNVEEFDDVWNRSGPLKDGTRLMDEIDLIVTKMGTGRPHDAADMRFLQTKVESAYRERLRTCSAGEAAELFERFATPDLALFAATQEENQSIRSFGLAALRALSDNGDLYARQLFEELNRSGSTEPNGR